MGQPVNFSGSNIVMRAPDGAENVQDMHVFQTRHSCVSCWEVSAAELSEINRTGRIFLSVLASGQQPPVYVGSESACREVMIDFGPVWDRPPTLASEAARTLLAAAGIEFQAVGFVTPTLADQLRRGLQGVMTISAVATAHHSEPVYLLGSPAPIPAGHGWQPIETAPKDGAPVDLWVERTNVPEGDPTGAVRWPDCHWDSFAGVWVNQQGYSARHYVATMTPTHWMRPAAPSATRERIEQA